MEKSFGGMEPRSGSPPSEKPQRFSKRLVNLMSSASQEDHHHSSPQHHHHKLRSHTRSSRRRVSSGGSVSRNPSSSSSHSEQHGEGQELLGAAAAAVADNEKDCGEGGSGSSLLKLIIASSSCSPRANETNELSQQAGLGGTSQPKTTKRTATVSDGDCDDESPLCPQVAAASSASVSSSARDESGRGSRGAPTMNNDGKNGGDDDDGECEMRSSADSDNEAEMYQRDCGDPVRSRELPGQLNTSPLMTCRPPQQDEHDVGNPPLNCSPPPRSNGNEEEKDGGGKCRKNSVQIISKASVTHLPVSNDSDKRAHGLPMDNVLGKDAKQAHADDGEDDGNADKDSDMTAMPEIRKIESGKEGLVLSPPPPPPPLRQLKKAANRSAKSPAKGKRTPTVRSESSSSAPVAVLKNKVQVNNYNTRNSSSVRGKPGEVDNVDGKKTTFAPMLLMNNLPYMGELTFDTRPRRGRKPKKADICHLISKNYGIQFPVSYINLPNTGGAPLPPPPPPPPPLSTSKSSAHHKRAHSAASTGVATHHSSPSSSQILPPPAFCNRDVSIVPIPSNWGGSPKMDKSPHSASSSSSTLNSLSLAHQLMSQQSISMLPLSQARPTQHHSTQGKFVSLSKFEVDDDNPQDEEMEEENDDVQVEVSPFMEDFPLNLCLRDSNSRNVERMPLPLSLCKGSRGGGEGGGVGEETSLDVRWNKSVLLYGASNAATSPRTLSPADAVNYGKRNASAGGLGGKSCKSVKLSTRTNHSAATSASSYGNNNSSSSHYLSGGDDVSNLVNHQRNPTPSPSPSFSLTQYQCGKAGSGQRKQQQQYSAQTVVSSASASSFLPTSPYVSKGGLEGGPNSKLSGGGKEGKYGGSRKKRGDVATSPNTNLRGDISISASSQQGGPPQSASSSQGFSSIGGTLFGQSTLGLNDNAEVSICKFKFTGGAKPCLQEKKMLSVDAGGNFRFYTDKTTGTAPKVGKGHTQLSTSTSTCSSTATQSQRKSSGLLGASEVCQSQNSLPSEPECHFALSSLPKSAKSMSMCMSISGNTSSPSYVHSTTTSTVPTSSTASSLKARSPSRLSLPLAPSTATSSSSSGNPIISVSPTTEDLHNLHLMEQSQQRATASVSPFHGEYSYSSSNSCSSDTSNTNENSKDNLSSSGGRSSRLQRAGGGSGSSALTNKMKMKRRRRTRKSLMREKLEKTFKEKGFLIQTQQLESAEGATYCKFRQLRKFTRYLFRSWKDYLPDHVKEISDNNAAAGMQQVAMEQRPDSGKMGAGLSPSRKESRNSVSKDGHGSLDPSIDLRSLGFRDEDGDEDDGDADDDDEFDEDEQEGMISEDDNDNNNHVDSGPTLSALETRGKDGGSGGGRSYLLKESVATSHKDDNDSDPNHDNHNDDENDEEVNVTDSSLAPPRLPPSTTITLTKSVDDEEELQVDG